mgnify:CR=1 FL=1
MLVLTCLALASLVVSIALATGLAGIARTACSMLWIPNIFLNLHVKNLLAKSNRCWLRACPWAFICGQSGAKITDVREMSWKFELAFYFIFSSN